MDDIFITDQDRKGFVEDTIQGVPFSSFAEAKEELLKENAEEYLARIAGCLEVDYEPIEEILGDLTKLVHEKFDTEATSVTVIPRGSFTTRTAIEGHVDLNVDVIFPEDYPIPHKGGTTEDQFITMKKALGTDATGEKKENLKNILRSFWETIGADVKWLQLAKPLNDITRSLPLITNLRDYNVQIPIDIFIKVQTSVRGQDTIIGVDKNSPIGNRRYQITTFIPLEGRWLGDRILSPVGRMALLSLKWWKYSFKHNHEKHFRVSPDHFNSDYPEGRRIFASISMVDIKSHHLLAALNALHELDPRDELYLPNNVSSPFTMRRVKQVMWKVLEYLNRAYHPETDSLFWLNHGKDLDIAFPQFSHGTMERLFVQAKQDPFKFMLLKNSKVIPTFRDEIGSSLTYGLGVQSAKEMVNLGLLS